MTGTILGTSKLSSKHQVTVPKDARELLDLKPGQRLVFVNENGKLVVEKA